MNEQWLSVLEQMRARLSEESFETWLAPIRFDGVNDHCVVVAIPNRFYGDWIRSHYMDLLVQLYCEAAGCERLDMRFVVDESLAEQLPKADRPRMSSMPPVMPPRPSVQTPVPSVTGGAPVSSQSAIHSSIGGNSGGAANASTFGANYGSTNGTPNAVPSTTNLNPKYSFDSYVVGPSNQLAHAASMAAASSPGKRYNPLFIYGGVGLGKTHLVNAVGHRVLQDRPNARIQYVSAERFTNEFIWSLQNHKISEFRDRYRNQCDVLLMDDIQFLARAEQTQEEFFHTFNALYHSDKQIVVTSDAYPQQIGKMEERLISRFQWGMVADIQAPELDTRVAIVRKKAEQEGIVLSDEVTVFLAQTVKSNVRELEGTLLRLAVKAELLKRPIDLDLAKEALRATVLPNDTMTTVEDIQRAVCEYFSIRISDLKSHRRHRSVAYPRMIAMYLCRQRLNTSYTELGDRFGGKDHTTVMSAVRRIESQLGITDNEVGQWVEAIEHKLARS